MTAKRSNRERREAPQWKMADGNEVKKPGDFGGGQGINKMPIRDDFEKEMRKKGFADDKEANLPRTLREED